MDNDRHYVAEHVSGNHLYFSLFSFVTCGVLSKHSSFLCGLRWWPLHLTWRKQSMPLCSERSVALAFHIFMSSTLLTKLRKNQTLDQRNSFYLFALKLISSRTLEGFNALKWLSIYQSLIDKGHCIRSGRMWFCWHSNFGLWFDLWNNLHGNALILVFSLLGCICHHLIVMLLEVCTLRPTCWGNNYNMKA